MVTVDHPPNDDRIFEKEAKSLKALGFDVTILCKANADGTVTNLDGKRVLNPGGALEFELDGIPIIAVKRDHSPKGKLLHKFHLDSFSKGFIRKGISINPDAYHAHEPISMYLAMQMRKKTGAKVVFDSHESWMGGTRKEQALKRLYLKDLQYLITANTITRGHHLCLNPALHTEVIYNFPDPEVFNLPFDEHKLYEVKIAHDGLLFFNRGLRDMVKVMEKLKETHPEVKLKIIGEGGPDENQFLQSKLEEGLDNIEITGWLDYAQVPQALHDCSIGLIMKTRKPINNVLGGPAIKLFNYFASGMAVVDVGLPESTFFLNQTRSGVTIQHPTVDNIYRALVQLIEDRDLLRQYCQRSYNAFKQFQWPTQAQKLADYYHHVVFNQQGIIIR
jgi:glycosyltransferase involved in cell wall biosynthesis